MIDPCDAITAIARQTDVIACLCDMLTACKTKPDPADVAFFVGAVRQGVAFMSADEWQAVEMLMQRIGESLGGDLPSAINPHGFESIRSALTSG